MAGDSRSTLSTAAGSGGSRYRRSFCSMRILLKVLYWVAVVAISLALVVGLILWFESQDASEIEGSGLTTIRSA
jgi:cytochrome b subunit of formate dehydrogenase